MHEDQEKPTGLTRLESIDARIEVLTVGLGMLLKTLIERGSIDRSDGETVMRAMAIEALDQENAGRT